MDKHTSTSTTEKENPRLFQNNHDYLIPAALLQRKSSVVGRWRQRLLKKNKKANSNTYFSFSEMIDSDYASNALDFSTIDISTVSHWSISKALVQSAANIDSSITDTSFIYDDHHISKVTEIESNSELRCNSETRSSPSTSKPSYCSKVISRKMKSFRSKLRSKSFRTLAVLWDHQLHGKARRLIFSQMLVIIQRM